jgi:hypothetical protein
MEHLLDALDVDGRPLGELSAGAAVEHVRCPYADSRLGLPMNRSALDQIRSVWPDVLALFAGAAAREPRTVAGAWRASVACMAAAALGPRPVPRDRSAAWKASLGYQQTFALLTLVHDRGDTPLSALGTGAQFVAWCDREGMLVGQVEACAGPSGWIARGFEVLADPPAAPPFPLSPERARAFQIDVAEDLRRRQALLCAGTPGPPGRMPWHLERPGVLPEHIDRLL